MVTTVKLNTASRVRVRILNASDQGVVDLLAGDLTATLSKGGASAPFVLTGKVTPVGDSSYWIATAAGDADTLGLCTLTVLHNGNSFIADFQVVANITSDVVATQTAHTSALDAITAILRAMGDEYTRMVVTARDGSNRATAATVFKWDSKANYDLGIDSAVGRTSYTIAATYHASGRVQTFNKG